MQLTDYLRLVTFLYIFERLGYDVFWIHIDTFMNT